MEMPKFISGITLSRRFYKEEIKNLLQANLPDLRYSAALIGQGSEILGLDTTESTDHDWGPRLTLFLSDSDYQALREKIDTLLCDGLPKLFFGYAVRPDNASKTPEAEARNHRVEITTIKAFFLASIGIDPYVEMRPLDWLTLPEQKLLEVTEGEVFFDGLNELNEIRYKFTYYPKDVWLYLLSSQWSRIAEQESFVGRTGRLGNKLGTRIISARLVYDLMKLCFLMEKKYAPYIKWFGARFGRLKSSKILTPIFEQILGSASWRRREKFLSQAYEFMARLHNRLKITPPLEATVSHFHQRPYLVIHARRFAEVIRKEIKDEKIRSLPYQIGAIDQVVDNTFLLCNSQLTRKVKVLYEPSRDA